MVSDAEHIITLSELAQELRHIAEKLANGGDVVEAVNELHELAEELDPDGLASLMAYVEARDESSEP